MTKGRSSDGRPEISAADSLNSVVSSRSEGLNSSSTKHLHTVGQSLEARAAAGDDDQKLKWYNPGEHRRIIMNVVIISLAFELLFTAFLGMASLQSSLHTEGGIGVISMGLTHVFVVISAMLLPTFVIQKFTAKYAIIYAMLGYTTFLGAQFYPNAWTLIISSIIVGICAAPLWASKCTYITHVGHVYAGMVGERADGVVVRFFAIFFFSFQSSLIWGNLISSVVLSYSGEDGGNSTHAENASAIANATDVSMCGRNFCPSFVHGGDDIIPKPPMARVYTLTFIYLAFNCAAVVLVWIFVDPLSRFGERDSDSAVKSTKEAVSATFRQMGKLSQILLIPLTFYSGLNLGFYFADFFQAFVACVLGVESIGYIGMGFGASDAISSIAFGIVVKYVGRIPVLTFSACIHLACILLMFNYELEGNDRLFLVMISIMWGIGDSIWQTQINGLYGVLFKDNSAAAFSNYRLWESTGFIVGFVNSSFFCIHVKLYLLVGVLGVGMCGYYAAEYLEHSRAKNRTK